MADIPKPKKKRFYKRLWFWASIVTGVLVLVVATIGVTAYQQAMLSSYDNLKESVDVRTRTVKKTISTEGTVVPDELTQLYLPGSGTITEVNYAVGDDVDKDDIIAKAEVSAGGPSFTYEVKAPFDGRIVTLTVFENDVVTPQEPVAGIGFRSTHIEFLASDSEVLDLDDGQEAKITVSSYEDGDNEYDAEVTFVDSARYVPTAVEAAMATESGYRVKVSTGNMPDVLKETLGLSVDIDITVEERSDVLSITTGAIQYDSNDEPYVYRLPTVDWDFVQRAQGVENVTELLERQYIEIGFRGDEYAEVTDGLRDGERVLLYVPSTGQSIF